MNTAMISEEDPQQVCYSCGGESHRVIWWKDSDGGSHRTASVICDECLIVKETFWAKHKLAFVTKPFIFH